MARFEVSQRVRSDFARAFAQVLRDRYGRPAVVSDSQVRKKNRRRAPR
jgi:hypothetical protein